MPKTSFRSTTNKNTKRYINARYSSFSSTTLHKIQKEMKVSNNHSAEISEIWIANSELVALFEIHFRSFFFDVEKRR